MRGSDGQAESTRAEDDERRRSFGSKAMDGLELKHLDTDGLDYFPAAEKGAETHGRCGRKDDPYRHVKRMNNAFAHEGHGDDPHHLLRVVRAMAECHQCR